MIQAKVTAVSRTRKSPGSSVAASVGQAKTPNPIAARTSPARFAADGSFRATRNVTMGVNGTESPVMKAVFEAEVKS